MNNGPGFYVSADCWTGDAAANASSSYSAHFKQTLLAVLASNRQLDGSGYGSEQLN